MTTTSADAPPAVTRPSIGSGGPLSATCAEFVGSGGEYFRIWIVNLLLTLSTLGIYSAWAKVRREQYFHRNTRLAGTSFDWDGAPLAILRGRILAVALLLGFQFAAQLSPVLAPLGPLVFVVALPWLVTAALRFRLHHTLHRGLRFGFRGSVSEAARAFLLWPAAGAATLGALLPLALQRQRRFVQGHATYGSSGFESDLPARPVYGISFASLCILLGVGALGAALLALLATSGVTAQGEDAQDTLAAAMPFVFLLALLAAGAFFRVRLQNLTWNHLRLGPHRFRSDQTVPSYLALQLGNLLAMVFTLGLFRPWAAVRTARYRFEHLSLLPGESLDGFAAGAAKAEPAAADEIADLFGFDIGF